MFDDISRPHPRVIKALDAPIQEAMAIDCLTADQYAQIFRWDLSCSRRLWISTPVTVNLGAIFFSSPVDDLEDTIKIAFLSYDDLKLEDTIEIASLSNVESELEIDILGWGTRPGKAGGLTGNSWTRYFIFAVDGLR